MPIKVPLDSQCLTCGYLLRGLDESVCPECARAFDPEDQTTYNVEPRRRRRRRIKRLIIALVAAGLMLTALWPSGMNRAQITFSDTTTGHTIQVKRWEPQSPSWLPIRYPGFHWTTNTPDRPDNSLGIGLFTIVVNSQFAEGSRISFTSDATDGSDLTINGIPTAPENAVEILRLYTDADNPRIQIKGSFGSLSSGGS